MYPVDGTIQRLNNPPSKLCQGLPYEQDKDALIPPRARLHGGGGPKVGEVTR